MNHTVQHSMSRKAVKSKLIDMTVKEKLFESH
jgi:hypothetical protein